MEDEEAVAGVTGDKGFKRLMEELDLSAELDALDERNATIIIEGDGPMAGTIISANSAGERVWRRH